LNDLLKLADQALGIKFNATLINAAGKPQFEWLKGNAVSSIAVGQQVVPRRERHPT